MLSLALTYLLVASQVNAAVTANPQAVGATSQFERRHHEDGDDHSHHVGEALENHAENPSHDSPAKHAEHTADIASGSDHMHAADANRVTESSSTLPNPSITGTEVAGGATHSVNFNGNAAVRVDHGVNGIEAAANVSAFGNHVSATPISMVNEFESSKTIQTVVGNQTCEVVVSCTVGQHSTPTCVTSTKVAHDVAGKPTSLSAGHVGQDKLSSAVVPVEASPESGHKDEANATLSGARSNIPDVVENLSSGGSMKYAPAFAVLVAIAGTLLI